MVPKDLDYQTIIMVHRKALNKLSIKRLHYNAFKLKLAKKKIYVFYDFRKQKGAKNVCHKKILKIGRQNG